MANVICLIHADYLSLWHDNSQIGEVREVNDEPVIQFTLPKGRTSIALSFGDIAIIQDNWIALKELNHH